MIFNLHYLKTDYNTTLGVLLQQLHDLIKRSYLSNNNEGQLEENSYDLSDL